MEIFQPITSGCVLFWTFFGKAPRHTLTSIAFQKNRVKTILTNFKIDRIFCQANSLCHSRPLWKRYQNGRFKIILSVWYFCYKVCKTQKIVRQIVSQIHPREGNKWVPVSWKNSQWTNSQSKTHSVQILSGQVTKCTNSQGKSHSIQMT